MISSALTPGLDAVLAGETCSSFATGSGIACSAVFFVCPFALVVRAVISRCHCRPKLPSDSEGRGVPLTRADAGAAIDIVSAVLMCAACIWPVLRHRTKHFSGQSFCSESLHD
jgi:hypothetical protein